MLDRFALNSLNSGELLGIVAQIRALDLGNQFLAAPDPLKPGGVSAEDFFDEAIIPGATANTVTFFAGGQPRAFS
jgi:hypothetical protein